MNKRTIYRQLLEALSDTPVVFLRGARQTGKTTLVKQLAGKPADSDSRRYISLDSATALAGALDDPPGFLRGKGSASAALAIDSLGKAEFFL